MWSRCVPRASFSNLRLDKLPAMSASDIAILDLTFVWLGMVLAISFVEAPLKFRAPGVTLQIGLGIGRLVFRVLNGCELALAVVVAASFAIRPPGITIGVAAAVAAVTLLAQV